jgi:hypothetical protein
MKPNVTRSSSGQTIVIVACALPILVAAIALGTDIAVLYFNSIQVQKAADAGAIAGANYLNQSSASFNPALAKSTAKNIAQANGVAAAEITSVATTVGATNSTLTITVQRTVPYYFARVLGLTNGTVTATAAAGPKYQPTTVNSSTALSIPPGGGSPDNNGNNGVTCASIGACDLIPIGLNSSTPYVIDQQINLQQGQVNPGNWDLLALGGVGGSNLRSNIANGYNGQVTVGDWLTTEPGKKVGPVDQGFSDRLSLAASVDPSGTYASHTLTDPRVLILPVVDWSAQTKGGRASVPVKSFATVWLDSVSGGQVTVHFISQVIANSYGDPNIVAPDFGARGAPILLK